MKTIIMIFMIAINLSAANAGASYQWNAFIQRAMDVSYALKQDDIQVEIENEKIAKSTLWENPNVEIELNDELHNGIDYNYFEFSQKLPAFGENSSKKQIANLSLEGAKHLKESRAIDIQYKAASLFQKLYFLKKKLDTLEKQIVSTKQLQQKSQSRKQLGEISSLEHSRIEILTHQLEMKKQSLYNKYIKAQLKAQALLNIDSDINLHGEIVNPTNIDLDRFMASLEQTPEYLRYKSKIDLAKEEMALIKTTRYALPEVYLYSTREDDVNSKTNTDYGVGFRLSVPLWDRKNSDIEIQSSRVNTATFKAQAEFYEMKRKVMNSFKLYQNSSSQLESYKKNLLDSSREYYEITLFSFELGEKSLLELLDAQALYFQAQLEYQDLVSESYRYWLQLSYGASINLLKDNN